MISDQFIKEDELEKSKRKLQILNEVSKIINSIPTKSLDEVLKEILDKSLQIAETDKGFIALIDEYSGDLTIKAIKGSRIKKLKTSEGITGRVAMTGEPYLCNNVTEDKYYKKCWEGIKTELAVPLTAMEEEHKKEGELELFPTTQEKVIGVLNVEGIYPFTEEDKEILSSIARYTAIGIENARLYRDRKTLYEIGKTLSESKELYELLDKAVKEIPNQLHAKACSIFLLDEKKGKLTLGATTGLEPKDYKTPIEYKIGEGLTGWIAKHGRSLRIKDINNKSELERIAPDLEWKNKFPEDLPYGEKLKQFLGVPIKYKDKVIGVIRVSRKTHDEQEFTYRNESSLTNIANYIAMSIMNARLYEEKLKKLVKISDELMKNLHSEEELSSVIVRETKKILETDICALFLLNEEGSLELKGYSTLDDTGLPKNILRYVAEYTAKNGKLYQFPYRIGVDEKDDYSEWSLLCAPVMNKGEVIGVLEVGDEIEKYKEIDFLSEDKAILESLATKLSTAIEIGDLLRKLKDEDKLKTEILQTVSHTLQSPLAGAQMCLQRLGRVSPEKLLTYSDEIYHDLQRFKRTIEHLLDYAKMEISEIKPKREQVDIKKIVEDEEDVFSQRINEKEIRVKKSIPKDISKILVDRIGIERIVNNLLSNAIRFSDKGREIEINLYDKDKEIMLEIVNYGEPIPESEHKKVFDKFYRRQTEKERTIEGSGLGLYITKNWVKAHNGRIWVESSKDKGTRFKVILPKGGS